MLSSLPATINIPVSDWISIVEEGSDFLES
jgi:hypothetical protein